MVCDGTCGYEISVLRHNENCSAFVCINLTVHTHPSVRLANFPVAWIGANIDSSLAEIAVERGSSAATKESKMGMCRVADRKRNNTTMEEYTLEEYTYREIGFGNEEQQPRQGPSAANYYM